MSGFQREVRRESRTQTEIEAERFEEARRAPSISYVELTAALERQIDSCRKFAASNGTEANRLNQYLIAGGCFDLWNDVTAGQQSVGDQERLRALVEAVRTGR